MCKNQTHVQSEFYVVRTISANSVRFLKHYNYNNGAIIMIITYHMYNEIRQYYITLKSALNNVFGEKVQICEMRRKWGTHAMVQFSTGLWPL